MLCIKSFCGGVIFPDNEPIAVYSENYHADCYGHKLDENDERIKSGKCYDYGNVIFQTPSMKVTFPGVYCGSDWCFEILDYIQEHITNDTIILDLDTLVKNGDDYKTFDCGTISVE